MADVSGMRWACIAEGLEMKNAVKNSRKMFSMFVAAVTTISDA